MKEITPHGYQTTSVSTILGHLTQLDGVPNLTHNLTPTIAHSAPTGAGKTITMIHLVEQLIRGFDGTPRPNLRVLWVSDSPQLNAQTRAKFQRFSDEVDNSTYIIDDDNFDEEYLKPGAVGFINTQKLSSPGLLLRSGDGRHYSFWDTMNNTLRDHFNNTVVIIDEAHLGWGLNSRNHSTILSRFLDSQADGATLARPPKVVGISATPQRFLAHCENIQQNPVQVNTNVEHVRVTGALKDDQVTHFDQDFDAFLTQAASQFSIMSEDWREYHEENQDTQLITPLLCIQVQDGQGDNLSETPLGDIVATLRQCDLGFELDGAIFHCFSQNQTHNIGGLDVPYIAPSTISGRDDARIILFKTAIATGWDCPRAEVLVSDRHSEDFTVICQLIGRMVRAPLHQRIEPPNDNLNAIHLYLPRFNQADVNTAIGYLQGELGVDLTQTTNPVTYPRRPGADETIAALSGLPSYRIHRFGAVRPPQFRLLSLCTRLEADGLVDDLLDAEVDGVAAVINAQSQNWREGGFIPYVEGNTFEYIPVTFDVLLGERRADEETIQMNPTESSFTRLFEENSKVIPQSIVRAFNNITDSSFNVATVNLNQLINQEEFIAEVERHCQTRIDELREEYSDGIQGLSAARRVPYRSIILEQGIPEQIEFEPPAELTVSESTEARNSHLYVNDQYQFHCDLTGLERDCLGTFSGEEEFVGWYRNPTRDVSGLRIPYRVEDNQNPYDCGTQYGKFPDFLVVRKVGDDCVVDIYEPHAPMNETRPWYRIAQGFAHFAERHGESFGRIIMSAEHDRDIRYFDFQNEQEREIAYSSDSFLEFWNAPRDN